MVISRSCSRSCICFLERVSCQVVYTSIGTEGHLQQQQQQSSSYLERGFLNGVQQFVVQQSQSYLGRGFLNGASTDLERLLLAVQLVGETELAIFLVWYSSSTSTSANE